MYLFKSLSQRIYVLLTICVILFIFNSTAIAHTVNSNASSATLNKQVIFSSTFTFNGQMGTVIAYIDYGDGTGEKILDNNLIKSNLIPWTRTYSSTHAYSKKGRYIVRIRTVVIAGAPGPTGNPATMNQLVSKGIEINRIQILFENNRPEITINRNDKSPGLSAKIDFSGIGYLKGYWEIDGRRLSYVFKQLTRGPSVIIKYPDVPPLPTFKYGTHNVRFIITNPVMNINFPYGIYFVRSDPKKELAVISLLEPVEGEDIAYKSLTFKWRQVNKASLYLINIFSKTKEDRIFSAYTRQGEYILRPNIIKTRMKPEEEYIWNVIGFD
jgi:hypothetical protein